MDKLSILIFDGSEKKSTFVDRLIYGLVQRGHKVSIAEFHSDKINRVKGASYINLGSERKKLTLVLGSLKLFIFTLFKSDFIKRSSRLIRGCIKLDIKEIKKINFLNTVLITKPDVVHLQWLSLLPFCEELLENRATSFLISQRGTHINVRPFVNEDNYKYLKQWFAKIDGFHSVSKAIQQKSNLIYSSENKVDDVIYSGLNIEAIEFNKHYNKGKTLSLLSVGRPHWIKGYASMMQVCVLLKKAGIDFNYTIVGANNKEEELVYLIAEYQLEDVVRLKSKVLQEEVFSSMRSASALILPSLEEGIANVAIEAMAIGLPVISTECGGMPELIEDSVSGFLVPLHDIDAFVNTIVKFHKTGIEEIDTLRLEARRKVELQHNMNKMIIEMENLYYKCII